MWSPMDAFNNWVIASPMRLVRVVGIGCVLMGAGVGIEAWTFADSRFEHRYGVKSPNRDMPMGREGRLWHVAEYAVLAVFVGGVGAYALWVAPCRLRRARNASSE